MSSWQATILNTVLRLIVKPTFSRYAKNYAKTKDIKIIYRLRKRMAKLPLFLSPQIAKRAESLLINKIPVVQIAATTPTPTKTILYLHGGVYVAGSPRMYLELAYYLAKACDANVLLVDYRLAPEHRFPAALEDALAVYQTLRYQHKQIILAGDSAGGGLALATLIAIRDKKLPAPAAAFCLSPWTDLALTGESLQTNAKKDAMLPVPTYQLYTTKDDSCNPLASPLYADLQGLPPLLIFTSDSEILLDDAKRFATKAQAAGVTVDLQIWRKMPHIWPFFARFLPEGRTAIMKIANFVTTHSHAETK